MASSACGRENHSYSVFSPQVTVSDSSYLGDCVNKEASKIRYYQTRFSMIYKAILPIGDRNVVRRFK